MQNQIEKPMLSEAQLAHVSTALLPLLVAQELSYYKSALHQPVVKYSSKESRYVRLKHCAVPVPSELTKDAVAMANFILEQCNSRPANTDTPMLFANTDEALFDTTKNFSIEWTQYTPLAEDEATELAHNMAKSKIRNLEYSCKRQSTHKSTRQLLDYYQATFPECFHFWQSGSPQHNVQ